jgi:hypothetical protein
VFCSENTVFENALCKWRVYTAESSFYRSEEVGKEGEGDETRVTEGMILHYGKVMMKALTMYNLKYAKTNEKGRLIERVLGLYMVE